MNRCLLFAAGLLLACSADAWAQTGSEGGETGLGASQATGASASQRPHDWITAARARHRLLIQARVNNPRAGEPAGTTEGLFPDSGESSNSASSSLSNLLNLLSGASGGSGSLGDLSSLLGGLTGDDTTGSGSTAGSSGTTGGDSSGTGMTLDDLLNLRDQLLGTSGQSDTSGSSKLSSSAQERETREGSGAIGRLPKIDQQQQQATGATGDTEDRKLLDRLAERMVDTFFSALALAFQSQDFVDLLMDQLRPIFFPAGNADTGGTNGSTSGGSSGGGSSGGTGGSGSGSGSGGGIEDVRPPGGNSSGGGSGSIV